MNGASVNHQAENDQSLPWFHLPCERWLGGLCGDNTAAVFSKDYCMLYARLPEKTLQNTGSVEPPPPANSAGRNHLVEISSTRGPFQKVNSTASDVKPNTETQIKKHSATL